MKKKILILSAAGLLFAGSIAAQSDYSRWSLALKAGLNYYRLSTPVNDWDNSKGAIANYIKRAGWSAPVVELNYTVNPYFGIGLEGGLFTYNRFNLSGNTIDLVLNSSVNLSNFLAPTRSGFWKKGTFYGTFGLGAGRYTYEGTGLEGKSSITPLVAASLNFDYSFSPVVALILEGQYRSYFRSLAGGAESVANDNALLANVGLRFNFGANNEEKPHTRNVAPTDYYAELYSGASSQLAQKAIDDAAAARKAVDSLANDTEQRFQKQGSALLEKLNKLERDLKNLNNAKPQEKQATVNMHLSNVEFNSNSTTLSPETKGVLDAVAEVLKANATGANIIVAGHSDDVGSDEYNQKISVERAETVIKYLQEKGVVAAFSAEGYGKSRSIADNTSPAGRQKNRRVEFQITKK